VQLNPAYEAERPALERTLANLQADLVLPMLYKDEVRGVLSLGRKKSGKLFTPEDFDLLKTMLSQSAIALENARLFRDNLAKGRMEEELKIAHDIQMGMLPEKPPSLPGVEIAARTVPAREVGGDFYDFVEFGGRLGLLIGDVSGKGVSAGLLMAGARSTYHKVLDREAWTHAVVSAAVVLDVQNDVCRSARVVLGGVAPIPWRLPEVETMLAGQRITPALAAKAGEAAVAGARPLAKNGYKVPLTRAMVARTLVDIAERGLRNAD